ncbi:MAG: CDP-alcohol phosphatidyltransferase family protein [Chitinophagales bacterium]|nr:CDP-alcohol phosphatidyltransferase family protein [Chitinophagaceae bacterium]MCB9065025.1 CDP-alcohol phosphatidyltransferase family protein [Chitinophagales bacterium]
MKNIPIILVYSRLVASLIFILIAAYPLQGYKTVLIALLIYGILSDFFDGFIARKIGVSNEKLRRADSTVDQVFWIAVIAGTAITSRSFYSNNGLMISIILLLEALCYIISYIKFRKEVATHAIASKLWVVTLFACFIDVILNGDSTVVFYICFVVGVITRLEIVSILLVLKKWTNDVPSIYHAIQLRKGKTITRNKLFNG